MFNTCYGILTPKVAPTSSKKSAKLEFHCTVVQNKRSIFLPQIASEVDFESLNEAKNLPNINTNSSSDFGGQKLHHGGPPRSILDAKTEPKWRPKSITNRSKTRSENRGARMFSREVQVGPWRSVIRGSAAVA